MKVPSIHHLSIRPGTGRREATKKALPEYGGPYPLSFKDLVVSSGHLQS